MTQSVALSITRNISQYVLPIVIDAITFLALSKLNPRKSFWLTAHLCSYGAGLATLYFSGVKVNRSNPPLLCYIVLKVFYSIFHKLITKPNPPPYEFIAHCSPPVYTPPPIPQSFEILLKKYDSFMEKFKVVNTEVLSLPLNFENTKAERQMQEQWHKSEIIEQMGQLIENAVIEMDNLYRDLEQASSQEPEQTKYKKMGELLTTHKPFSDRFISSQYKSLLDIYRVARGLCFILEFPNVGDSESRSHLRAVNLQARDVQDFFSSGTPQYKWRTDYNNTIQKFIPIIQNLNPMEATPMIIKCLNRTVQDDQKYPGDHRLGLPSNDFRILRDRNVY